MWNEIWRVVFDTIPIKKKRHCGAFIHNFFFFGLFFRLFLFCFVLFGVNIVLSSRRFFFERNRHAVKVCIQATSPLETYTHKYYACVYLLYVYRVGGFSLIFLFSRLWRWRRRWWWLVVGWCGASLSYVLRSFFMKIEFISIRSWVRSDNNHIVVTVFLFNSALDTFQSSLSFCFCYSEKNKDDSQHQRDRER